MKINKENLKINKESIIKHKKPIIAGAGIVVIVIVVASVTGFLVANPSVLNPGGEENPYAHTITIDGVNDFTASTEEFSTSNSDYKAYITWDANNIYIGMNGSMGSSTRRLFVYFGDGSGIGESSGEQYDGPEPILPFNASYCFQWSLYYDSVNLFKGNGTGWTEITPSFSGVWNRTNSFFECKIPKADIGITSRLQVHISIKQSSSGNIIVALPFNSIDSDDFVSYYDFNIDSEAVPSSYATISI